MTDDSGALLVVTAVILLILAIALGAVIYIRRRRHSLERSSGSIPLIVFPDAGASGQFPARPGLGAESWAPMAPRVTPRDAVPPPPAAPAPAPASRHDHDAPERAVESTASVVTSDTPSPVVSRPVADFMDTEAAAAPAHGNGAVRPADGTLQFLPGRLEIVEGQDVGQEIRFVRTGDHTEITFGRSEGPLYRHVQLREQTVSRVHARLTRDGSRWRLTNLSTTNPLHVNGAPLDPPRATVLLADGDRIEMGEVVLRFRSH